MQIRPIVKIIALIELLIGLTTLSGLTIYQVFSFSHKSLNLFIFIMACALVSFLLGWRLLRRSEKARVLIIFFSGYVIITKALIFLGLITFNGEIITFISAPVKNIVSILYHGFLIYFLTRKDVRLFFNQPVK